MVFTASMSRVALPATCLKTQASRQDATACASRPTLGKSELQRGIAELNGKGAVAMRARTQKFRVFSVNRDPTVERQKDSKVDVKLGEYKNGTLRICVEPAVVDEAAVDAELKKKMETTYKLNRVNFTGSGAKMGHTVKIDMEGKYAEGPQAGQSVPGTTANMFELELTEGKTGIWKDFVSEIVSKGMGQMESKTFVVTFPSDYPKEQLRDVGVRFTVTVKEISEREELEKDTRPVAEQRAEVWAEFEAAAKRKQEDEMDLAIRAVLEQTCQADTKKIADSVSWAKFGPKSMAEFTWNLILEEISKVEGIPFHEVASFLRAQAVLVDASDTGAPEDDDAEEEMVFN